MKGQKYVKPGALNHISPAFLEFIHKNVEYFQLISLRILWTRENKNQSCSYIERISATIYYYWFTFCSNRDRPNRRNWTPAARFHIDTQSLEWK